LSSVRGNLRRILALLVITVAGLAATGATGRSATQAFGPIDAFYSVTSLPSGKWLVAGASGVLLTSDDNGKTWTRAQLAQIYPFSWLDLFSVRFAPDHVNGWISGEQGLVLKTTDGGKTWQKQQSGVIDNLYRVAPVDAQNAVAAGVNGAILYTHDGGKSWQQARQKNGFAFFDLTAPDASNAWVVGEFETILHSADGGKTWTVQRGGKRGNFRQPAYFTVRFRDSMHGWLTGQGATILVTSDGGKTWQPVTSPTESSMFGTFFTDAGFWVAGDDGVLLNASLDGSGKPASVQPTFSVLNDVAFAGQTGIAVGFNGTILRSDDGGSHWKKVSQE
jgi:photosystem II stability/assembly factor-like uncharacterized protein